MRGSADRFLQGRERYSRCGGFAVPFAALYHVFLLSANACVPQEILSRDLRFKAVVPGSNDSRPCKERKDGAPEILVVEERSQLTRRVGHPPFWKAPWREGFRRLSHLPRVPSGFSSLSK